MIRLSVLILWIGVGCIAGIDWLVERVNVKTTFTKTKNGTYLLTNGLIAREFVITPNFATIDFRELQLTQASVLRAINPESIVTLNGRQYNVGGFISNMPKAYLNRTALWENYTKDESAFQMVNIHVGKPEARFPYIPARGAPKNIVWPPPGLRLTIDFEPPKTAPENIQLLKIRLFYEMYDEIPLLSKWIEIQNIGLNVLEQPVVEYLAVNWQWRQKTYVEPRLGTYKTHGWLHVEADEQMGPQVKWDYADPATSNEPGSFAPIVNCTYLPFKLWKQQDNFISYRVNELVIGSDDMERVALSRHRMIRLLAPHTQENPIFFHMINTSSAVFKVLVDQLAEVGFEMIIYSFGSGLNVESDNETYITEIKQMVDYAKSKGIEVGAYDLVATSRAANISWQALNPTTDKPIGSMCFASGWYDYLMSRIWNFYRKTGLTAIETDGSYGGYPCNSKTHTHHRNVDDSIIRQAQLHKEFNMRIRRSKWYMNQPSFDFYIGISKTGMGYDENQYNLPRWQDLSISRQSIFEGTWVLHTTQGWMFLPLVDYHGGGAAAAFEPLTAHIEEYQFALAQYFGNGVAACYRGYRIFDSNQTKAVVQKWVNFYKEHRGIVTSDIIHIRYPDMQGIDAMLHVNPWLDEKGLLMVYNPTRSAIKTSLEVRLYHTGLTNCARVQKMNGDLYKTQLSRDWRLTLDIDIDPISVQWYVFMDCSV